MNFANGGLVGIVHPLPPDMGEQVEDSAREVKRLERCINDLVSLLALPASWIGSEPSQIVGDLLNGLLRMLSLDFIYARLGGPAGEVLEFLRASSTWEVMPQTQEIGEMVQSWLGDNPQNWPESKRKTFKRRDLSMLPLQLGLQGEIGVLVAGSERIDFPQQAERLVLSVATNQATVGLKEAWLLNGQKRTANQLERQVAERTEGLATANEELRQSEAALHKALDEIKKSEAKLRQVIDAIPTLAWCNLPDGPNEFLNKGWHEYTGLSPEQSHGWGWQTAFHPDDLPPLMEKWTKMLASGEADEIEARLRRHDGVYRWFMIRAQAFRDESGNIIRWYGTSTDIDDRKRAEEELRHAQSELARVMRVMTMGQLTASIAHEVNQPLSGIITNAGTCLRMLDANPPNVEGARETARRTIRDGKRASDVITRLRTLYSKKEPALEPMDLNEVVREVTALSSTEIQKNGVTLRQEFVDGLPPALGDRIQLQQVILNLLRNAVESMRTIDARPRELLVRTERDKENHVRLSVKDSGVGFTPQAADKIFQPFYTTKSDGMGIGLSISRSIIEAHQGRLWASSNDGPGCTFSFAIPCTPEGFWPGDPRQSN
jgi:PAS domain S-box-containing protein